MRSYTVLTLEPTGPIRHGFVIYWSWVSGHPATLKGCADLEPQLKDSFFDPWGQLRNCLGKQLEGLIDLTAHADS